MAFWIKKKTEDDMDGEKDLDSNLLAKKKKEEKKPAVKRLDNLRIPQQLKITLRSLGAPNEYLFLTKDLSATGAFVLCSIFKRYPFQTASTILEAVVELQSPETHEVTKLSFLAKVARVVEAHGDGANQISGFGIRIIQMATEQRQILENFIARHGSPEVAVGIGDVSQSDTELSQESDNEASFPEALSKAI